MIDGKVDGAFRAEDYCESLVPVSHLGVSRGRARVGGTATHRSFAPLAFREIKTLGFVSHCPSNADGSPRFPPPRKVDTFASKQKGRPKQLVSAKRGNLTFDNAARQDNLQPALGSTMTRRDAEDSEPAAPSQN